MEWLSPWEFKKIIQEKYDIVEVIKKYDLDLKELGNGSSATHKLYCPFHQGKNGGTERTPSCCIYSKTNSFHCFSCGANGQIADFISKYEKIPVEIVISNLVSDLPIQDFSFLKPIQKSSFNARMRAEEYLLQISKMLFAYIDEYKDQDTFNRELNWMENVSKRVDAYIENSDFDNWELVKKLKSKIERSIIKRKQKYIQKGDI